jgi:hypothetical protein
MKIASELLCWGESNTGFIAVKEQSHCFLSTKFDARVVQVRFKSSVFARMDKTVRGYSLEYIEFQRVYSCHTLLRSIPLNVF